MKIEMTSKDLAVIIHNIKIETAREIERYLFEMEESEHEEGVYGVELEHMVEHFMDFTPTTATIAKV